MVDNLAKKQIPAPGPRTRLFADPLQLRALGGLLASGNYDAQTLEHLANTHQSEASTEFYEVLLGVRNKPTVRSLNVQLDETRAELQSVNGQLTASINENEQLKTARRGLQREKDTLSEQLRTAQQQLLERNATISTLNTTINTLRVQLLAEQTRNRRPQPPNQFNRPTF